MKVLCSPQEVLIQATAASYVALKLSPTKCSTNFVGRLVPAFGCGYTSFSPFHRLNLITLFPLFGLPAVIVVILSKAIISCCARIQVGKHMVLCKSARILQSILGTA